MVRQKGKIDKNKLKYYLIKSPVLADLNIRNKTVYLGEWCNMPFDEKFKSKNIIKYPWDDRAKLYKDYLLSEKLYKKNLEILSSQLNAFHKINYSIRQWEIIIGPWLKILIGVLIDRYEVLRALITEYNEVDVKNVFYNLQDNIPNDTKDFIDKIETDIWNENVFSEIIDVVFSNHFNVIEKIKVQNQFYKKTKIQKLFLFISNPSKYYRHILFLIKYYSFNPLLSLFFKKKLKSNNYFLKNTYLTHRNDTLINKQLNNRFTYLYDSIIYNSSGLIDKKFRIESNLKSVLNLDQLLEYYSKKYIPKIFLEDFKTTIKCIENSNWPASPKVIFTSNSFHLDDIFKIWTSLKIVNGSKLIIGQHGGNYGIGKFNFSEAHELSISDYYFTWGWKKSNDKIVPMFNLKLVNTKLSYNPRGSILLVTYAQPRYSYFMYATPMAGQYLNYLDDQIQFINNLKEDAKNDLNVRLYFKDYGWDFEKRLRSKVENVKISDSKISINEEIANCKLFISTYNASTYLETLFYNVPTVIFFNLNHWEIREEVMKDFKLLNSVGIFHANSSDASNFVNQISNDIEGWWKSNIVQEVVREFCGKFSKNDDNAPFRIATFMKNISAS